MHSAVQFELKQSMTTIAINMFVYFGYVFDRYFKLEHFCFVVAAVIDHDIKEDLSPVLHENQQLEPQPECVILVPRSNILNTMVEEFKDPDILQNIITLVFIGDNGSPEMGGGAGIPCEILSLFWREFSISLAIGAAEKSLVKCCPNCGV